MRPLSTRYWSRRRPVRHRLAIVRILAPDSRSLVERNCAPSAADRVSALATTGASLVPVMVMVSVCATVAPCASVTLYATTIVVCSPTARWLNAGSRRVDRQRRARQAHPRRRRARRQPAIDRVLDVGNRQRRRLAMVGIRRTRQQVLGERTVTLGRRSGQRTRHHRRVVGAGDGDGLGLRNRRALRVRDVVRTTIVVCSPTARELNAASVGSTVSVEPDRLTPAGAVPDASAAIDRVLDVGNRQRRRLAMVGIRRARQQVLAERTVTLGRRSGQRTRHHRRVVGAGDGDGLGLRNRRALRVRDVVRTTIVVCSPTARELNAASVGSTVSVEPDRLTPAGAVPDASAAIDRVLDVGNRQRRRLAMVRIRRAPSAGPW